MKLTYDKEADAAYIRLLPRIPQGGVKSTKTVELEGGSVNLDFDAEGRLVGVEILGAAGLLPPHLLRRS